MIEILDMLPKRPFTHVLVMDDDVLINTIKSCTDTNNRYAMMHIAEDMLMATGCIVPLYFYTDIYMLDDSVEGFFSNPLGYKYFMNCTIAK